MDAHFIFKLKPRIGDLISITNEKGEVFQGVYQGDFNESNSSFSFLNHSNGKTETILIAKLQYFDIVHRTLSQ